MCFRYLPILLLVLISLQSSMSVCLVSADIVDSRASAEVISFNGENIVFKLEISTSGNHACDKMWIKIEPTYVSSSGGEQVSTSVSVEIWRMISDVVYYESTNKTVFTYCCSCDSAFYKAGPKLLPGLLVFPFDEHGLTLFIEPSFNITIDEGPSICRLSSPNYEGSFEARFAPNTSQPRMYRLAISIKHAPSFVFCCTLMLVATASSIYILTIFLFRSLCSSLRRKQRVNSDVIRVASTMIFFVPAFEIAFNSLKSPLPLTIWDPLMILVVPLNAVVIIISLRHENHEEKEKV